jgi:hypothetical protein
VVSIGVGGSVVTGVTPKSPPNAVAYSPLSAITKQHLPTITADYEGSITESFDLKSFFWGCGGATAEGVVNLPRSCQLTVTGYRGGNLVATQPFKFTPDNPIKAAMTKATLNKKFVKLDTVRFATTSLDAGITVATGFDNVIYTTCAK